VADPTFTPSDVRADLDRLEKLLKRLATEYEMFLAGSIRWPPWQRHAEVEAIVRHYAKNPPQRTIERFRFNTMVHRLRTSLERWNRRQRAIEMEGHRARLAGPTARPLEAEDVNRPHVMVETRASGGKLDAAQLRDLYTSYKNASRARGLPVSGLTYRSFARKVDAAVGQARSHHPGRDVELLLDEVGGKVRLVVRPGAPREEEEPVGR